MARKKLSWEVGDVFTVPPVYEHLEYFPFGETWVEENSNVQRTPYLFTAKELDEETGLYYFGARYYDPRTSVWQNADPALGKLMPGAGRSAGQSLPAMGGVFNSRNLSMYAYAHHNPLNYNDPDGRWSSKNYPGFDPVHQMAITKVLGNQVSAEATKIMHQRQVAMDKDQSPESQHKHAMIDSRAKDAQKNVLTRDQQINLAENFLRAKLDSAKKSESSDKAFSELGDAIHVAQDATSPVHRGFQDWNKQSGRQHVYSENRYPPEGSRERRELEGATQWMHDIYTGKAEMPKQL